MYLTRVGRNKGRKGERERGVHPWVSKLAATGHIATQLL